MAPPTQEVDYVFINLTGTTYDVDVVATTTLAPVVDGGGAEGYAIQSITGDIDISGVTTTITGQSGVGGALQYSQSAVFDNTLFATPADGVAYSGASGSTVGIDNPGYEFFAGGVEYNLYTQNGSFFVFPAGDAGDQTQLYLKSATPVPCFCAGTMIRMETGEIAVENLAIGDKAITADGLVKPITWIGRRVIASRFGDALKTMPIRISAGALGDNVPSRDLRLSPGHAVLIDGVLIHAGALVNGVSIQQEKTAPDTFVYYHVELADHSLIVADGTPAETFVDDVERMGFDNWDEHEALFGDDRAVAEMEYPRAKAHRQVPVAIRGKLAARAAALTNAAAAA